jgi:S1/P1 Nuclease/DinB superfamily
MAGADPAEYAAFLE